MAHFYSVRSRRRIYPQATKNPVAGLLVYQASGSGGRTRTCDLPVMGPYRCVNLPTMPQNHWYCAVALYAEFGDFARSGAPGRARNEAEPPGPASLRKRPAASRCACQGAVALTNICTWLPPEIHNVVLYTPGASPAVNWRSRRPTGCGPMPGVVAMTGAAGNSVGQLRPR